MSSEGEGQGCADAAGAMLDGEAQLAMGGPQVEERVPARVAVTGIAQVLPRERAVGLAGVVHQDGQAEAALQGAQVGEQGRDLLGGVFVEAARAHEGLEDDQAGAAAVRRVDTAGALT